MGCLTSIRDFIETLIHPSARRDPLTSARHRAFIAPRLIGSMIALGSFPVCLLVRGTPSVVELGVFAWLIAPILTAHFLSRTGRYESAHVLSSLALTGLVTAVTASSGGIASFAAIWLVVVPLEAAQSASRRIVAIASSFVLGAAGLLVLLGVLELLPPPSATPAALAALGIVSAALYATGLALGAEALARTSFWLFYAEEERYSLLAGNITDVITRHGRDGAVLFASPAAETLFGTHIAALNGHGLFDRVHVADWPAYLIALGDAAALSESTAEFRVRRDRGAADGQLQAEFIWIEMRCRPLQHAGVRSAHDGCDGVVAVLRDVTERKRQQQALIDAHAEAQRANAAKSRFLAAMSHELRTPLNAIIGSSDMLTNEAAAAAIGETDRVGQQIDQDLIERAPVRDHFRQVGGYGSFKDDARFLRAQRQQIATAGDHLCGRKRFQHDLEIAGFDLRKIENTVHDRQQMFVGLVDQGGIFVAASGIEHQRAEATAITFAVEDTGIGISDEDQAHLGEPYFESGDALHRGHGGTGLGLSIVKGLVQLHGGEFSIRSHLGEGTRVSVRLPLDCERTRVAKPMVRHSVVRSWPGSRLTNLTVHSSNSGAVRTSGTLRSDVPVKKRA